MAALTGSVALVTGASRGLGAATAKELARLGAHVIITGRVQGGLEETDDAIRAVGGTSTLLPFDLAATDTIDALGPSIHERFGRLDILVHAAAALGVLTPVAHIQKKDFDHALAANVTAVWHLIGTCAPLLTAAPAGRAAFVTAARARAPKAYWGIYGATKAALEHFTQTWADETATTMLRVNLFDPGQMATRLRRDAYPGEDQSVLPKPADIAPQLAALCLPTESRTGELIRAA
ncbi:MAG: SDR family NAD(P)-dependent oxidoreductase [Acetobacteraceae bacterium]|nr:SDR family NAD(P)-dependent oxidoreductase [Acetobacteraceae bacterium]MSP30404.1 SDR family NAD(P)-dependent oxidoreductase [Acetobacteraceae bacterium]